MDEDLDHVVQVIRLIVDAAMIERSLHMLPAAVAGIHSIMRSSVGFSVRSRGTEPKLTIPRPAIIGPHICQSKVTNLQLDPCEAVSRLFLHTELCSGHSCSTMRNATWSHCPCLDNVCSQARQKMHLLDFRENVSEACVCSAAKCHHVQCSSRGWRRLPGHHLSLQQHPQCHLRLALLELPQDALFHARCLHIPPIGEYIMNFTSWPCLRV